MPEVRGLVAVKPRVQLADVDVVQPALHADSVVSRGLLPALPHRPSRSLLLAQGCDLLLQQLVLYPAFLHSVVPQLHASAMQMDGRRGATEDGDEMAVGHVVAADREEGGVAVAAVQTAEREALDAV